MLTITYIGDNIAQDTYETLAASDIRLYLDSGQTVSIKPNLVTARPAEDGATTHPEVVEGIILFLKEFGVKSISIIESSSVGTNTKRAFKICGYEEMAERHNIPLIDLKSDHTTVCRAHGYEMPICNTALQTDFLINVPVLKAHCQTRLTCCMKNLKGCLPDSEKRRFHSLGLHKPIAALNTLLETGYCVVDGICGDLSFEEGGTPVESNRIIAGKNPLTVDSFCAELIGYRTDEIGYLLYGQQWGVGAFYSRETEILERSPENKPARTLHGERRFEKHQKTVCEDAACSACYAALMYALHRLGGRVNAKGKINIGQGFKSKSGDGVGIGDCTRGFATSVPGCPPKAVDIMEALKSR